MVIDASGNYDGTSVEMMGHMYVIRGGTILQVSRAYSIYRRKLGRVVVDVCMVVAAASRRAVVAQASRPHASVQYLVAKS